MFIFLNYLYFAQYCFFQQKGRQPPTKIPVKDCQVHGTYQTTQDVLTVQTSRWKVSRVIRRSRRWQKPATKQTLQPVSSWNRIATMFTLDTKRHLPNSSWSMSSLSEMTDLTWCCTCCRCGGKQHPLYLVCLGLAVKHEGDFYLILWSLKSSSDPGRGNPTCLKRSQLNHGRKFSCPLSSILALQ